MEGFYLHQDAIPIVHAVGITLGVLVPSFFWWESGKSGARLSDWRIQQIAKEAAALGVELLPGSKPGRIRARATFHGITVHLIHTETAGVDSRGRKSTIHRQRVFSSAPTKWSRAIVSVNAPSQDSAQGLHPVFLLESRYQTFARQPAEVAQWLRPENIAALLELEASSLLIDGDGVSLELIHTALHPVELAKAAWLVVALHHGRPLDFPAVAPKRRTLRRYQIATFLTPMLIGIAAMTILPMLPPINEMFAMLCCDGGTLRQGAKGRYCTEGGTHGAPTLFIISSVFAGTWALVSIVFIAGRRRATASRV